MRDEFDEPRFFFLLAAQMKRRNRENRQRGNPHRFVLNLLPERKEQQPAEHRERSERQRPQREIGRRGCRKKRRVKMKQRGKNT